MSVRDEALKLHRENVGKIEVISKVPVNTRDDMTLAYTPGVAEPCKEIAADPDMLYEYTNKSNLVAVVSDGSAVLGLGNIGGGASMPVMEGKCVLFKCFGGVDAFPICVNTQNVDDVVNLVKWLEPTFGGVNLEDIAAPNCFEVEDRLKKETNLPIFHDDQHGTAVVVLAAIFNALKVVKKEIGEVSVSLVGAGAAGVATAKLLLDLGVDDVILVDRLGIVHEGRTEGMNPAKEEMARRTNKEGRTGSLADAMVDTDIFIGLSGPELVDSDMVSSMKDDAIVFAMANPVPEIYPDDAAAGGARVIGTGRSDFPNQINNVLGFPGILRGALDVRSTDINEEMKIASARALADVIEESELHEEFIIAESFDRRVVPAIAAEVARAAMDTGVARIERDPDEIAAKAEKLVEKANRFFD